MNVARIFDDVTYVTFTYVRDVTQKDGRRPETERLKKDKRLYAAAQASWLTMSE